MGFRWFPLWGRIFLCLIAGGSCPGFSANESPEPSVLVRLFQDRVQVSLRGTSLSLGGVKVGDRGSLFCKKGNWVWSGVDGRKKDFPEFSPLRVTVADGAALTADRWEIRGSLTLFTGGNGNGCEGVATLPMETYLRGVVNGEFSSRWSGEAVAAQVIAARTYALYQKGLKPPGARYDVDATTEDQVFLGAKSEDALAVRWVRATQGWVLLDKKGRALPAFYHSTCGGKTELPYRVWGHGGGRHRRVICSTCAASPFSHWEHTFTDGDLAAILNGPSLEVRGPWKGTSLGRNYRPGTSLGNFLKKARLQKVRLLRSKNSGRVRKMEFHWVSKRERRILSVGGPTFRQMAGYGVVKSTDFRVEFSADHRWRWVGRGFGHGVGLCQWGAKGMAEKGASRTEILAHYYPGASLRKLW